MNHGDAITPQAQAQTQSTRPTGHNGLQNDNSPSPPDLRNGPTCFRCGEQGHMRAECRERVFCNHCRRYNHDTKACIKQHNNIPSPTHSQIATGYHPTATPPPLMGTTVATQPTGTHNNPLFNLLDNNQPRISTIMHTPYNGTSPTTPADLVEGITQIMNQVTSNNKRDNASKKMMKNIKIFNGSNKAECITWLSQVEAAAKFTNTPFPELIAYINHICCTFGPSRKILTDNGTEFKNKLWTEVFEKLRIEQKFTPIYSPQCNGRIKGFHKFLKAMIAKQLETHVEWDDLVWKATAAYNFFPTESSGIAPFFLMFGCEAAVKHMLLESENSKYLGTNDSMINVGLMTKLYNVVAHNLNEARKARDRNRKGITPKEPEKLKIGDNILVRDHTSKAFQPKYKEFCIVGLLGKNQVEIKDNHGHVTKVHCRDVKKKPMTEKVCKLYEEEQVGKMRERRKAVPTSKIPDLRWDIAETQLTQENQKENNSNLTLPLQTLIIIIILTIAILKQIITQIKEIAKRAVQAMENTIKEASRSKLFQNIKDFLRTTMLVMTIATNTTNCTNRSGQTKINNRNIQNSPGSRKLNDKYNESYQSLTSRTHSYYNN